MLPQHSGLISSIALTYFKVFYSRDIWNFESTVGLTKPEALNKCFVQKSKFLKELPIAMLCVFPLVENKEIYMHAHLFFFRLKSSLLLTL